MRFDGAAAMFLTTSPVACLCASLKPLGPPRCCCYLFRNDEMKWTEAAAICKHHSNESVCKCDGSHVAARCHRKAQHESQFLYRSKAKTCVVILKWEIQKELMKISADGDVDVCMGIYYGFRFRHRALINNIVGSKSSSSSTFSLFSVVMG